MVEQDCDIATIRRVRALLGECYLPYMSRATSQDSEKRVSVCQECGKEFEHEYGLDERSYCSRECFVAAVKAVQRTSVCEQCGTEFEHEQKERTYCSMECLAESNKSGTSSEATSICKRCGEEFTHPRYQDRTYCSKQCYLDTARPRAEGTEYPEVYEALEGLGTQSTTTQILAEAGYETEEDLRRANPQDLLAIRGIGKVTVSELWRNLDNPWPTPFKHGSGQSDNPDQTQPPQEATSETEVQQEPDNGEEGGERVKVCPFCRKEKAEEEYEVHLRRCQEA
ncbi:helix-hairpin-helix domain-containing protein [Halobaculum sp. D14]|uniref:helix-hairpin-helix domain-containing protein n=1 Tax=Halobaculum sp. D14 TaxID=3421642 RepID=UPI003EBF9E73